MDTKFEIPVNEGVCPRKQKRKKMIVELLLDYGQNSTIHGLRYMTEPGVSVIERIFWAITFMISVVLCFFLIRQMYYRKWVETPVIVSFNEEIVPVGMVSFPSVTICPQQKIMASRYNFTRELEKLVSERPADDLMVEFEEISLICRTYENKRFYTERNCSNSSTIDNILEVSPKHREVFDKCYWRGKIIRCDTLFTKVLTTEGVCYNFNSLAANETFKYNSIQHDYSYMDESVHRTKKWNIHKNYLDTDRDAYPWRGRSNGAEPDLKITMKTLNKEIDSVCNGADIGYKIYLQHPTDFPQTSLSYYAASPRQATSLALKFNMMTTSDSLEGYTSNVRKCYFPEERPLQYFQIYTLKNCQLECQSNYTFQQCGCVWFNMPHNDSESICTIKRYGCYKKALDDLAELELEAEMNFTIQACRCFPACNFIDYSAETTKSDYDSQVVLNSLDTVNGKDPVYYYNMLFGIDTKRHLREEYSKIEIYFKEPRFVSMRRSALYGPAEFLANIGGLLGLFLGFSFLSIVEIIYYTTIRFCCLWKRDLKAEKKENNRSD